jgi:tetratricopeptide (TPR) repeat protein
VLDFDEDTGAPVTRVDASGAPVLTRLDRAALEGMASSGGGRYVELSDSGALAALAAEFDALNRTTFATEETSTPIERFQVFAGIALAAAMGAMLVGHVRVRTARRALRLWPAAGAAIFIAGICASDAADHNRRGNRHYADGEFGKALDAYRTAQSIAPDEGELFHNAGNALNRAGELSAAIDETMKGLPEEDDLTAAILEYSLGNHYSGAQRLEEALAAYRRALLADPEDVDAKYNFELTARRLTPQPSPTPTVPLPELGTTPTPDDPTDQGPPGTPGAGGTPDVNASPQAEEPGDIPPEQLERLLEEALAGIDEEFTVDEAIRVLELVEQRNRDAIDRPQGDSTGLPDY